MTVESVLMFSVILESVVIIVLLVVVIFVIVRLTNKLSNLSTALKDLLKTITDGSDKLLNQAKNTIKTVENNLTSEKESSKQTLLNNIIKSSLCIFEVVNLFQKSKNKKWRK